MKKPALPDPFTLVLLALVLLCAVVLGLEGIHRTRGPVRQPAQTAPASAPSEKPQPATPAPAPAPLEGGVG